MPLLGDSGEVSSKASGNSLQIVYQWDEPVIGTDMGYRLDHDMPSYFA